MKPKFAVECLWQGKRYREYFSTRVEAENWLATVQASKVVLFASLPREIIEL